MKKEDIARESLKYNFLRRIIIRFDYEGMNDIELDKVLPDISVELRKHNYRNRTDEKAREVEIRFDDPEKAEYDDICQKNVREQRVIVFHNENPQVKLKMSTTSACISIEKTKYVDCLTYCGILWQVMQIVMNSSEKVPFFSLKRFGLRKINQCFLKDIQLLNEYFEPAHFRVFRLPEDIVTANKVMQLKDSFECGEYNVNLVRTIIKGEIQGEKAYQLNYDADIYLMDEEHIEELLREEKTINQMNKILFDLYKDAVTEKFLNQLIDGTFEQNVILGVDANEEDRV